MSAHTPGPWRVRRASLNPDEPTAPPACYGIAACKETWHHNKGHFHPEDARYPVDKIHVVEIGYDRDYGTPEAAIPRLDDACLIAAAPELLGALRELLAFVGGSIDDLDAMEQQRNPEFSFSFSDALSLTQARAAIAKATGES